MSNHSVIEHRANYHYVKMEEDYILICSQGKQYPHCKAHILSVLEHWTNDKVEKGQDVYIYMTYPEWIDALYGLFRRNHIICALTELEQEKLILKHPCKRYGKDSFEYALNVQEIQARLKTLPERVEKYTRPKVNAFKFKRVEKQTAKGTSPIQIQTGDPSKNKRNIDTITELPDRASGEERESTPAHSDASASAHSPLSSSEQKTEPPTQTLQQLIEDKTANKPTTPPLPSKQSVNKQQLPLLDTPLVEPDMHGAWNNEKVVQYAEWCRNKRYTDNMRGKQLNAAKAIHKDDTSLVLEDFKQAYDERNDPWWKEHKGLLDVTDMRAKGASEIDRMHEMLLRIESEQQKQAVRAASRANNRTVQPSKRTPTSSQENGQSLRSLVPPPVPSREEAKKEIV